ncbi:MAG: phospholipase [Planctomycetaceae bacterium]
MISFDSHTLGTLSCQVGGLGGDSAPRMVCILCHGFGAPATDLVPLANELLQLEPRLAEAVGFVFPAAPLDLGPQGMPGGRAWWPLDMNRLNAALVRGDLRDLREDVPVGLETARQVLLSLIDDVKQLTGLDNRHLVLGGFSQGAMLSTDVALHLPECAAGLCALSGNLLAEAVWTAQLEVSQPIPVLQSHGEQDPILPFSGATALRDLLVDAGFSVDFLPFTGEHTIPWAVLQRVARWLLERLDPTVAARTD